MILTPQQHKEIAKEAIREDAIENEKIIIDLISKHINESMISHFMFPKSRGVEENGFIKLSVHFDNKFCDSLVGKYKTFRTVESAEQKCIKMLNDAGYEASKPPKNSSLTWIDIKYKI